MYSRQIEGQTLTIAPSGWTYDYTFVLYDQETESLWYPVRGGLRAIQGPYFGNVLPELPSEDTSWRKWRAENPGSRILE